jgi:hypothetical protein
VAIARITQVLNSGVLITTYSTDWAGSEINIGGNPTVASAYQLPTRPPTARWGRYLFQGTQPSSLSSIGLCYTVVYRLSGPSAMI